MRSSFPSSFISCISIHAPTRGATSSARIGCPRGVYISIHAPTRGATPIQIILFMSMIYFNPRSHERSDISVFVSISSAYNFNPRSHERSDLLNILPSSYAPYFNPRSHERSDGFCSVSEIHAKISIHAPTRGATVKE